MIEKIVGALRKSFLLVFFKNIWLFLVSLGYSLLSVILILGSTALPVIVWVALGRDFNPGLLFSRPLEFIIEYRMLIVYAMTAYTVGFALFLVVWLYYHAGLTAVVTRAAGGLTEESNGQVSPGLFLRDGRTYFLKSSGTAALAGLLPLPPVVLFLAVAAILLIRLAAGSVQLMPPSTGMILLILAGVLCLVATVLLTILAVLWYRYALCAVCADNLGVAQAMGAGLSFIRRYWHGVLGLLLASIVLSIALSGLSMTANFAIKLLGFLGKMLEILLALPMFIVSMIAGVGLELWMKSALVVFYLDNRKPDINS
jgi:hypothetical protein